MRKLSTAFLIAGVAVTVALAGCGGGGGGTTPPPPGGGQVIITGTVMDNRATPLPVAGVLVKLNGVVHGTDSTGAFSFTLSAPPATLITDRHFYISTRTISQTNYPSALSVKYGGINYSQNETADGAKIYIPDNVFTAASGTVSLGTITVTYNDPNNPPPPPF